MWEEQQSGLNFMLQNIGLNQPAQAVNWTSKFAPRYLICYGVGIDENREYAGLQFEIGYSNSPENSK